MATAIFLVLLLVLGIRGDLPYKLPQYLAPPYPWVKTVHLLYQTHLDVGFTNFAKDVCEIYFYDHLPRHKEVAESLKYLLRPETYRATTHPWLLMEFFDGKAQCTNLTRTPEQIQQLEAAINQGFITWHAKPFSMFVEICDDELFVEGIKLSRELDQRFKQAPKITAVSKDVPGFPRSALPLLASQGVEALHIGVNSACLPAAVPGLFRWKHDGADILTMYYGGDRGYGYGGNVTYAGLEHALVYNFTLDNSDPLDLEGVIELWQSLKTEYPNANIVTSTLDDFVRAVKKSPVYASLPVFTGEMGDTWAYGSGADPFRVSAFREIRRIMKQFVATHGRKSYVDSFNRRLMLIPEHNWGLSDGAYLDSDHYSHLWSNEEFHNHRQDPQYQKLEAGWQEKRSFLRQAPEHIVHLAGGEDPAALLLADQLKQGLKEIIKPVKPSPEGYSKLADNRFNTRFFDVTIDPSTGGIQRLLQFSPEYLWADEDHRIADFIYQTFSYADIQFFNSVYNQRCGKPPCSDFSKVGMNSTFNIRKDWVPTVVGLFLKNYTDRDEVLVELTLDPQASVLFGAPKNVWITYSFPRSKPDLAITLKWFQKTATRLPEAMFLSFNPIVGSPLHWHLDVMGRPVNPLDVVVNGSRHLHSIWRGVDYHDKNTKVKLQIDSLDANLVAPGDTDHLTNFDGESLPNVENGMHFNIFNNLWGTAFNQWYDEDAQFRFVMRFGGSDDQRWNKGKENRENEDDVEQTDFKFIEIVDAV